ncbi:MAG: hypothetical protein AB4042_09135, partial [Leptolyngbyaceae cyanobacterium]
MNRQIYTLRIGYQPQQNVCTLLLQWNKGQQDVITASYPQTSINQYNTWKTAYKKHYKIQSATNKRQGGSIPFMPSGDACHDVKMAENNLLQIFKQWLVKSGGQVIENELRSALDKLPPLDQDSTQNPSRNAFSGIDIYLDYDLNALDKEIQVLPWERWLTDLEKDDRTSPTSARQLRVLRSPRKTTVALESNAPRRFVSPLRRSPKTRILAILADDPSVRTEDYWQQLSRLR